MQRSDLLDLHTGAEFHLVAGDGRATGAAGDRGVDLELLQHGGDRVDHLLVGRAAPLRRITRDEQVQRGQRVGPLHHAVDRHGVLLGVPLVRGGLLAARLGGHGDGGDAFVQWIVVQRCADRTCRARPRRRLVLGVGPRVVVVAVGEVLGPLDIGLVPRVGPLEVVVVVAVLGLATAGAEHRVQRLGQFPDRRAGQQQHPEQHGDDQQRGGDPRGHAVGEWAADRETDETGGALTIGRSRRCSGPQMPQPQHRKRDHRAPDDQPGAGLRVGLGAHQHDADGGDQHGQQHHGPADEGPQHRVDPGADRAGGVEPGTGRDHHRQAQQRQRDPVPAVSRFDLARPAHRARRRARALGQHQPRRPRRAPAGGSSGRYRRGTALLGGWLTARRCRLCRPGSGL